MSEESKEMQERAPDGAVPCEICGREKYTIDPVRSMEELQRVCWRESALREDRNCHRLGYEREKARAERLQGLLDDTENARCVLLADLRARERARSAPSSTESPEYLRGFERGIEEAARKAERLQECLDETELARCALLADLRSAERRASDAETMLEDARAEREALLANSSQWAALAKRCALHCRCEAPRAVSQDLTNSLHCERCQDSQAIHLNGQTFPCPFCHPYWKGNADPRGTPRETELKGALRALVGAPPARPLSDEATHRCTCCGALWRLNQPDPSSPPSSPLRGETWSLVSKKAGSCCDNAPMGHQIVPLLGSGNASDSSPSSLSDPSPPVDQKNQQGAWLIWSFEHDAWWAPAERGYTRDVNLAGRYPRTRAEEIVRKANFGCTVRNEAMVPAEEK